MPVWSMAIGVFVHKSLRSTNYEPAYSVCYWWHGCSMLWTSSRTVLSERPVNSLWVIHA